jgi:ATP-dependent helicase/nuclease subunit B
MQVVSEAKVFTVAPGLSLLDLLADRLLAGSGGDPLALARTTLFLPTRRACRAMQEALLRRSAGRALLLPRLLPLGDLDAAELILEDAFESEGSAGTGVPAENGVLPPVMPALRRQVLLARQILQWHEARGGKISADQAARLAQELARLFDQLETEGIDPGALAGLVPERFAAHWEETLGFLAIVT